jgi:Flp pilus assembly CpaE family ATPase
VSRRVVTAVDGAWEAQLVTALGATAGYTVTRRCPDLADLLAAAASGLADVALLSAGLRALDRPALHQLHVHGVAVAGMVAPGDEVSERRLRQLGVEVVVRADLESHELEDALDGLGPPAPAASPAGAPEGCGDRSTEPQPPAAATEELGRVVAVWGPTGAPGRTTTAVGIAAELAGTTPTLLVDLDTWGSSIAQTLGLLDEAPGVAAAARAADQGVLDLPALARVAPQVVPGLRVLTGIPRAHRWTELRAPSVTQLLTLGRRLASVVVVDCGFAIEDDEELSYDTLAPRRNATTLCALEAADDLLVVGAADPVGLQRLVRAVQDLDGVPSPRPRVVVNKVRASAVGSRPERRIAEALARFVGLEDLTFLPWDQASLDAAMFAGTTLREAAPQSPLRRALAELATSCSPHAASAPRRRVRR